MNGFESVQTRGPGICPHEDSLSVRTLRLLPETTSKAGKLFTTS